MFLQNISTLHEFLTDLGKHESMHERVYISYWSCDRPFELHMLMHRWWIFPKCRRFHHRSACRWTSDQSRRRSVDIYFKHVLKLRHCNPQQHTSAHLPALLRKWAVACFHASPHVPMLNDVMQSHDSHVPPLWGHVQINATCCYGIKRNEYGHASQSMGRQLLFEVSS
jgi:hypothetical protein